MNLEYATPVLVLCEFTFKHWHTSLYKWTSQVKVYFMKEGQAKELSAIGQVRPAKLPVQSDARCKV